MAEPAKYGLNEDEVVILRGVVARVKNGTLNTGKTSDYKTDVEEQQAPEVYIALTPEGGIPGLEGTGTGTGSLGADGTLYPGRANCQLYEIISDDDSQDPYLAEVFDSYQEVYNLSVTAVEAGSFLVVARDKFGKWHIVANAESEQQANSYIIRAPSGGIPATEENTTGTGTTPSTDDYPGRAVCRVYKLTSASGVYRLSQTSIYKTVFNLHGVDIPQGTKCLISRDGYGYWLISEVYWETATC